MFKPFLQIFLLVAALAACNQPVAVSSLNEDSLAHCSSNLPSRFAVHNADNVVAGDDSVSHKGMVWIPAGDFLMGASDNEGRQDEYPQHPVRVNGFWMDVTEVTNAQFQAFVDATGYVTTAEKAPDWNEIKKQLPPGTPKPADDLLVAASLVFTPPSTPVPLNNAAQWWQWTKGANWKHPEGPGSDITGKENYPVVQVSWDDAMAYAKWAGKRLPSEAEWEWAARGKQVNKPFTWGDAPVNATEKSKANIWQGHFPDVNTAADGYKGAAPVKSFDANPFGLYDMAGNVWEWCADWYQNDYYQKVGSAIIDNPTGPSSSFDPDEPTVPKRVVRGGSFLCHASYCASYRVSARMKTSPDTGLEHTGFRCVANK